MRAVPIGKMNMIQLRKALLDTQSRLTQRNGEVDKLVGQRRSALQALSGLTLQFGINGAVSIDPQAMQCVTGKERVRIKTNEIGGLDITLGQASDEELKEAKGPERIILAN